MIRLSVVQQYKIKYEINNAVFKLNTISYLEVQNQPLVYLNRKELKCVLMNIMK